MAGDRRSDPPAPLPARIASTGTVLEGSTEQWRDKKRYLWLIGLVVPSLAFLALGMHELTGWAGWFWIGPIVILGIVPAIDLLTIDREPQRTRATGYTGTATALYRGSRPGFRSYRNIIRKIRIFYINQ